MGSTDHYTPLLRLRDTVARQSHSPVPLPSTATVMAQSADPSASASASTTTNLFPTTTAGQGANTSGPGSANVYYLVFLGVLVIILLLAACLAFRAFRMRRRYRTATQLAIARGDPLPVHMRDDYWGLSGLPGFNNGMETTGPAAGPITGDRGGKKGKWDRIPKLEEIETAGKAAERNEELFDDITPVTLHSLLAPPDPRAAAAAAAAAGTDNGPSEPITAASSSRARRFNLAAFRRNNMPHTPIPDPLEYSGRRSKQAKNKEIDREIQEGEDMRLAVVIQMPHSGDQTKKRQSWQSEDGEEEEVGWEMGMELGVWEGTVGR